MTVYSTDVRLNAPLAADLVLTIGELYDRLGAGLADPLSPADEADELVTLLPYRHRVADLTRLTSRVLEQLSAEGVDLAALIPALMRYAEFASAGRVRRGTVAGLLLVAGDVLPPSPLAVRDQYLLSEPEFAALPERLTVPLFDAAVVTLRVVTAYVLGCSRVVPGMGPGRLVRSTLEGRPAD